jgi:type IV secretory pathway TraG/TraD family ATPase VirD4
MTATPTTTLNKITVNAWTVAAFTTLATLTYFALMLAAVCPTAFRVNIIGASIIVLATGIPTLWLAFTVYRKTKLQDRFAPLHHQLAGPLWAFFLALRVPVLAYLAGRMSGGNDGVPIVLAFAAVPLALFLPAIFRRLLRSSPPTQHLRGTRLLSTPQIYQAAAALARAGAEDMDWCGIALPDAVASGHFCLVGTTASGKTVSMRLLMQSVLPSIRPGSGRRALIYDAKQDCISILSGMKLHCPVVILNPFDVRSAAWDLAADITSPAIALQVAHALIPDEQGYNAFFVKAARDLMAAVFMALHLSRPGRWTLADVVLILSDTNRAAKLLHSLPQTRAIGREHFSRDPRTLSNIQSTISANVAMLRPVAAMWEHATQKISLEQWIKGDFILVLGNDETLRGPIDALNRVIFQRTTELVLAQPESSTNRAFFFLDEVKEMGKLDTLPRLLTKGRSKGARVVLAFQTIEGLRAVYGDHLADELAGMAANKALLRTDSPVTAKWAAQVLGEHELREWTKSVQHGSNRTTSWAAHIVKKESVLDSQIMQLPLARGGSYEGYFHTPGIGAYKRTVYFANCLLPLGNVPNFVPRPVEHQYLNDDAAHAVQKPHHHEPLKGIRPFTADAPDDSDTPPDDGRKEDLDDDDDQFDINNPYNS